MIKSRWWKEERRSMRIGWRSPGNCFKKRPEREWSESPSRKKRWLGVKDRGRGGARGAVRVTKARAGLATRSWTSFHGVESRKLEKVIQ